MKVLLLNPPADDGVKQVREGRCMQRAGAWTAIWTPLSLAYCAAVLRENQLEVKLVDCIVEEISFLGVEKLVKDYGPAAVVLNAVTPSIVSDLSTADHIKKVDPGIKTAIIGIHGTSLPEETLKLNHNIDFVVREEPERIVANLCLAIKNNEGREDVKGVSFRKDGAYVHNPDETFVEDLDALPYPAYDLIKTEKYLMPFSDRRFLLIATGRGCPFSCNFCADYVYYGKKLRLRKPESVAAELKHWKDTLGIVDFLFWSESFTLNREFAFGVAREIIALDLGIRWVCNSRVDHVDAELLAAFKKAGCTMVGFGLESASDEVLKKMNKKITREQIEKAVSLTKKSGIEVVTHGVIGFPGETEEMAKDTIRFVKKLDIDYAQFYCAVPFPGSRLYEDALRNNWIQTTDWRMFEQNFSVLKYDGMTPEKIMKLRNFAYRSFYFRPKILFNFMRKMYREGGIPRVFSVLSEFASWIK